jgi:hypothetical protein
VIGNIIAAVAVLEIQSETKAVATMHAEDDALGAGADRRDQAVRDPGVAVPALQRGRDDEAREEEEDQLVAVRLRGLACRAMLKSGRITMGRSDVAASGTTSLTHQTAIQSARPRTRAPAGSSPRARGGTPAETSTDPG